MIRFDACKRAWRLGCAAWGLVGLAACGGGGTQVDPFSPTRLIVFGDEQSLVLPDGRKYTVNDIDTSGNVNCAGNPIWVQSLAQSLGMTFAECNPNGVAEPQARFYAEADARVDDVAVQVSAHLGGDTFSRSDLVTVMAGQNDLLDLYRQFPGLGADELNSQAEALATQLAEQVNRIARLDGRVLFVTVPDLGLTPYALAEVANNPEGENRAQVLSDLTRHFNDKLKQMVINDGRYIGLVDMADYTDAATVSPSANGFGNVTQAACLETAPVPDCSTATLLSSAVVFFWADKTRLSPSAHSKLYQLALVRVRNNPF